ncbi:MAG: type II 3-dehydroquinate dehydratase [Geminicoccaceae bacterium]
MSRVVIINGPNLNLLGKRETAIYGETTLADVEAACRALAAELGLEVGFEQSNHEGVLIDRVHAERAEAAALIINAGGLSHTSVALADALRTFEGPIVEVHITNIYRREVFRHHSLISAVATGVICGLGTEGYALALRALAKDLTS